MGMNVVVLSGRLTANPELKTTQSGVSVCSFSIAVERKYNQGAEKPVDFINIVTWKQTAEFVSKYFTIGQMIGLEGYIQTRKYTDKDGHSRTAFEVVANNVHFMGNKKAESNDDSAQQGFSNANASDFMNVEYDGDIPF
jgi:single-strand DNA-binding protein